MSAAPSGLRLRRSREHGDLVSRVAISPALRLPLGRGIAGWVACRGESVSIGDAWNDARTCARGAGYAFAVRARRVRFFSVSHPRASASSASMCTFSFTGETTFSVFRSKGVDVGEGGRGAAEVGA